MPKFDKEYQGYLRGGCKNYNQSLISALEEMEKGDEIMESFDEYSDKAREIKEELEETLGYMEFYLLISFKEPYHDIARRFLNEVVGFEPSEED